MKIDTSKQLDLNSPVIFTDGTDFFNNLKKNYITHNKGLFILAPSGAGKSYYIESQDKNDWIDGDVIWNGSLAHPDAKWWLEGQHIIDEVDAKSDIITMQAKKMGFWILGASNNWLRPDAIVLPDWETHKSYIISREYNNYDGGAKAKDFDKVLVHRNTILNWEKKGVPKFDSVADAVNYLTIKEA